MPEYQQLRSSLEYPIPEYHRPVQRRWAEDRPAVTALTGANPTDIFELEAVYNCLLEVARMVWDQRAGEIAPFLSYGQEDALLEIMYGTRPISLSLGVFTTYTDNWMATYLLATAVSLNLAAEFFVEEDTLTEATRANRADMVSRRLYRASRDLSQLLAGVQPHLQHAVARQALFKANQKILQICAEKTSYQSPKHELFVLLDDFVAAVVDELYQKYDIIAHVTDELFEHRWSEKNLSAELWVGLLHFVVSSFGDGTATIVAFTDGSPESGYSELHRFDDFHLGLLDPQDPNEIKRAASEIATAVFEYENALNDHYLEQE